MEFFNGSGLKAAWVVGRVRPHRLSATLVVKGTFSLRPDGPAEPLPEDDQADLTGDQHADDDPERHLVYPTDFALYKPAADLLLSGLCHPPGGRPAAVCRVRFAVGGWQKSLAVIGDRIWRKGRMLAPPEPEPFESMPLGWDRSFGGPGFKPNPAGCGIAEEDHPQFGRVRRLPNLEFPDRLMKDVDEKPSPANLGPVAMHWPPRSGMIGTYDRRWQKEEWPWFPRDFDWTFFNAAPPEQQLKGYLAGDEPLELENLSPLAPLLRCRLPGLRMRWFVGDDRSPALREVPLNLDTLFVDAEASRLLLVWRGVLEIQSKVLDDVPLHWLYSEPLSQRPTTAEEAARLLKQHQAANAAAAGAEPIEFEPLDFGPPAEPDLSWVELLEKDLIGLTARVAAVELGLGGPGSALAGHLPTAAAAKPMPPPPPKDLAAHANADRDDLVRANPEMADKVPPATAEDYDADAPKEETAPAAAAAPAEAEWTRERCAEHAAAGGSFAQQVLSGLDLSGLALKGSNFQEAVLKGTRLAGADLSGADFTRADLSGADLKEARLAGAVFREVDLTKAGLARADLSRADVSGADLSGASLVEAVLEGLRGQDAILFEADLSRVRAAGCELTGADLGRATLDGADFSRAALKTASLEEAQGKSVLMEGADLTGLAASGAILPAARMKGVVADGSVWQKAALEGVNLSDSRLERANFEGASLAGSTLARCNLRNARLPRARLQGTLFVSADMFQCQLEDADLEKADFRGANLYQTEFYESRSDKADFRGANLKGTKLA